MLVCRLLSEVLHQVNMILKYTIFIVLLFQDVLCKFGPFNQTHDFVEVRPGAHMFYWMFYTTANVQSYTDRPLIVWLQGGPGGSSTAIGNFEIMGPLDQNLQERNHTWVKNFNVMYLDNPVGTGFSYVEDFSLLTTTNEQIADDFVAVMEGFYAKNPEFEYVPLYIYGQSYGGKMAVDIAIKMKKAEASGRIRSNLRGFGMGNAWISPIDATLTWGPILLAAGLIDDAGYEDIQASAREAERLFNAGQFVQSTLQWSATQSAVFRATGNVDFYNILTKMPVNQEDTRMERDPIEISKDMLIHNRGYMTSTRDDEVKLTQTELMDMVKEALELPDHVVWDSQSNLVFNYLMEDFMKPVTDGIEKLLNETDLIVMKYNGNMDLICDTPGQILWVDRLKWSGAEAYSNMARMPIWEDGLLEGYYKSYGNFRFFWINDAGHSVPRDNPQGTRAFLRDMTSFG